MNPSLKKTQTTTKKNPKNKQKNPWKNLGLRRNRGGQSVAEDGERARTATELRHWEIFTIVIHLCPV